MAPTTSNLLILKGLEGNEPVHLDALQTFLAPHVQLLHYFWVTLWWATLVYVIVFVFRQYRLHRARGRT